MRGFNRKRLFTTMKRMYKFQRLPESAGEYHTEQLSIRFRKERLNKHPYMQESGKKNLKTILLDFWGNVRKQCCFV